MDFSRIEFVTGSGTEIQFGDAEFDFCCTISSSEHFGGIVAAPQAMREMARVTKPGGAVAVATEFLLLPEYQHYEYFNEADLRRSIIGASQRLKLVSKMDWNTLPREYLVDFHSGAGRKACSAE